MEGSAGYHGTALAQVPPLYKLGSEDPLGCLSLDEQMPGGLLEDTLSHGHGTPGIILAKLFLQSGASVPSLECCYFRDERNPTSRVASS